MDSQNLTSCFDVLRREPRFFGRENIAAKLKCLEVFKTDGKPHHIEYLSRYLKHNDPELRNGAADAIGALFSKIESQTAFYRALKHVDLETGDLDYFRAAFPSRVFRLLLCLATFNRDGFVREKAVAELVKTQSPQAIRFIIFRLADWAKDVRETAENSLRLFFQSDFIDEFLRQIPLIEWLLTVGRSDLTEIYNEIYRFIFGFELNEALYHKLNRLSDKTKTTYVRNYLKTKPPTKDVFELLCADKLFLVKIELLKHIEGLDTETQKTFIRRFLQDRSAKVRVYAIYSTKPFRTEFYESIHEAIFDISVSVRELARFVLRESPIDFAALYRQRLRENETDAGAIFGLSEVGTKNDLKLFETYLQNPSVKIKIACLAAINRVDKMLAKSYAAEFLNHPSTKVRNKSIEILSSSVDDKTFEIAREIYREGDYERKKTILKLFDKIGGWKVVGDFILTLSDPDERIRDLGWLCLERWRDTQQFTQPTAEELETIRRLYDEFDRKKGSLSYNRENFWAQLPFYLR